jgi:phage-related protein
MDKEKIKQKIKELEALLEEPENKIDTEFKLKLNTGKYHYLGDDTFNCFLTEGQTKIASDRKSAQDELLQMAFILNGDWKPDFANPSESKYYIYFVCGLSEFRSGYNTCYSYGMVYFKIEPIKYFLATASDNLKAYIKGELQ